MTSTHNVSNLYDVVFTDLADPRTNNWFLLPSPVPGLIVMGLYLLFVKVWGPRYMDRRKPMDLNPVLIIYNFSQVLISAFLVYEAVDGLFVREDFSFRCQPLNRSRTKEAMREARCIYFYFLAKISELLETVFFVLRKKTNQVTFLHVYHHTVMPLISWGFAKYSPGGHAIFIVFLNSFVHVVMYLYYMLAAFGPKIQKYLWWKKYITVLQMVQFVTVAFHNIQLFYTKCNYPTPSVLVVIANSSVLLCLFSNFYRRAYKVDKKTGVREKVN